MNQFCRDIKQNETAVIGKAITITSLTKRTNTTGSIDLTSDITSLGWRTARYDVIGFAVVGTSGSWRDICLTKASCNATNKSFDYKITNIGLTNSSFTGKVYVKLFMVQES